MSFAAVAMIVSLSAFSSTHTSASSKTVDLYWYDTNDAGTTLTNPDQYLATDSPVPQPCDGPETAVCAQGFTEEETVIDGIYRRPNITISLGDDAHKE
ncbi:hypothetical protein QWY86_15325 [Pedobacter aquatilis]|uniref:hypothetical protein n=1 Tax=Pedobacter aquatilis TaxID=351343 RepID=UPI0025B3915C|nr:hypothetical protein [Pedobacter aquatilis]MDN3588053.1 hypothetical protein [Pedobacter aquatilis]